MISENEINQLINYAAERQKEIGIVPSITISKELQELFPELDGAQCISIMAKARAKNRK